MKFLLAILITFNCYALSLAKVEVSPNHNLDNIGLILNGAGIRKATWLKVKVYVGSLYLSEKTTDYKKILSMKGPKFLRMHFVRNVGADKLKDGWREAFKRSLSDQDTKTFKQSIDTFIGSIQDMEENQIMDLSFYEGHLKYTIKGKEFPVISQPGFANKVLSVWFVNAEDEGLKNGLLGL